MAMSGDLDRAISQMRKAIHDMFQAGQLVYTPCATAGLVEMLLYRGTEGDVAEAQSAIDRLADGPADDRLVVRDIWLLCMRALLAKARSDENTYRDYRDRYRAMATELGFEGHMKWAEAMP
jgi:hypothetical protein